MIRKDEEINYLAFQASTSILHIFFFIILIIVLPIFLYDSITYSCTCGERNFLCCQQAYGMCVYVCVCVCYECGEKPEKPLKKLVSNKTFKIMLNILCGKQGWRDDANDDMCWGKCQFSLSGKSLLLLQHLCWLKNCYFSCSFCLFLLPTQSPHNSHFSHTHTILKEFPNILTTLLLYTTSSVSSLSLCTQFCVCFTLN